MNTYKWPIDTWKSAQHIYPLEKWKSDRAWWCTQSGGRDRQISEFKASLVYIMN